MGSHFVTRIHATFSILTYIFEAVTKLAQLHKRLHDTSGFRHFPHESARNSCLDSSTWYSVENPSASARISVSTRAGNSRNSSEKCKLSVSSTVYSPTEMLPTNMADHFCCSSYAAIRGVIYKLPQPLVCVCQY